MFQSLSPYCSRNTLCLAGPPSCTLSTLKVFLFMLPNWIDLLKSSSYWTFLHYWKFLLENSLQSFEAPFISASLTGPFQYHETVSFILTLKCWDFPKCQEQLRVWDFMNLQGNLIQFHATLGSERRNLFTHNNSNGPRISICASTWALIPTGWHKQCVLL